MARPFGSVDALFARAREIAHAMPLDEQIELIDAHPRLGAPPADVSALSFVEQGYDRDAADRERAAAAEAERAARRRRARPAQRRLRGRFGFRYCVFVAGRSRAALLPGMAAALDGRPRRRDRPRARRRRRHRQRPVCDADRAQQRRTGVIELGANRYGKAAIRLVRVARGPDGDRVRDLTVAIALEGDFDGGPHRRRQRAGHRHRHDEEHRLRVRQGPPRRLDRGLRPRPGRALPRVDRRSTRATVNIRGHHWARDRRRRDAGAATRSSAAARGRASRRSARPRGGTIVEAGVEDLDRDEDRRARRSAASRATEYTTLPETDDRLMATKVTAIWRYGSPDLDFDATFAAVRATLLEVFADHDSPSVQTSIWIMARAILERHEEVDRGPDGPAEPAPLAGRPVAVRARRTTARSSSPTTEPHGLIEATVRRGEG